MHNAYDSEARHRIIESGELKADEIANPPLQLLSHGITDDDRRPNELVAGLDRQATQESGQGNVRIVGAPAIASHHTKTRRVHSEQIQRRISAVRGSPERLAAIDRGCA